MWVVEHRFIQAKLLTGWSLRATSDGKSIDRRRFRPVCLLIQYRCYTFDRDKAGKKSKRSTPWSLTAPDKVQKHPEPLVKLENPGIARYLWSAHIFWSYQSLIRVCCRVSSFDHGLDFPAIFLSAPIRGKSGSHEKAGWSQ